MGCENNENKQKEAGIGPFKNQFLTYLNDFRIFLQPDDRKRVSGDATSAVVVLILVVVVVVQTSEAGEGQYLTDL